jgi:hypothetical protein
MYSGASKKNFCLNAHSMHVFSKVQKTVKIFLNAGLSKPTWPFVKNSIHMRKGDVASLTRGHKDCPLVL